MTRCLISHCARSTSTTGPLSTSGLRRLKRADTRHGDPTHPPKPRPSSLRRLANGAISYRIVTFGSPRSSEWRSGSASRGSRVVNGARARSAMSCTLTTGGRGVGTAIARALLGVAFESLNLHRVMATCDPRNLASAAVLQKVGMTFEGQLRHTMQIRDGWRDSSVFSVLANEWPALPA